MPDRSVIHEWAVSRAAAICTMPIGTDVIPLVAEEVAMVVRVGGLFGVSVSKAAAKEIIDANLGGIADGAIFEAANVEYPFSIPVKTTIAVAVLEIIGNAAYSYFEKCGENGRLD